MPSIAIAVAAESGSAGTAMTHSATPATAKAMTCVPFLPVSLLSTSTAATKKAGISARARRIERRTELVR